MIRKLIPALIVTLLTTAISHAQTTRPAPIAPITRSVASGVAVAASTQPTFRPTIYLCVAGKDHYAIQVPGFPSLQAIEPQWISSKLPHAAKAGDGILADEEDAPSPQVGDAKARSASRRNAGVDWANRLRAFHRQLREGGDPNRIIVAFTCLPIAPGVQYGEYVARTGDNVYAAGLGGLDYADALAIPCYLDISDAPWMTKNPPGVAAAARRLIDASRVYNKRLMLTISARWVDTGNVGGAGGEIPDTLLAALMSVAADEQIDVCLWSDGEDPATVARWANKLASFLGTATQNAK